MNTQSHLFSDTVRMLLLWASILALVLLMFPPLVTPASAAGSTGWVEASASVPPGFDKHIIVCVTNQENYETYATRLMEMNGYVSQFQVPAGNYVFESASLENSDFRYNTDLVRGPTSFTVAAGSDTSASLEFRTSFNIAYETGAALEPPADVTTPTNPTEATVPEEPTDAISQFISSLLGRDDPKPTEETSAPTTEATEGIERPSYTVQEPSHREPSESTEATEPEEPSEPEEKGLTFWQRLLYTVLAAGVFTGVVFLFAYFYRRHLESS